MECVCRMPPTAPLPPVAVVCQVTVRAPEARLSLSVCQLPPHTSPTRPAQDTTGHCVTGIVCMSKVCTPTSHPLQDAVIESAPDSVRQLFGRNPDLMFELHCATVRRAKSGEGGGRR